MFEGIVGIVARFRALTSPPPGPGSPSPMLGTSSDSRTVRLSPLPLTERLSALSDRTLSPQPGRSTPIPIPERRRTHQEEEAGPAVEQKQSLFVPRESHFDMLGRLKGGI